MSRYEANLELIQAGPAWEPMRVLKVMPDPKAALAGIFARLLPDEFAAIYFDRREIPMHKAAKIRQAWAKQDTQAITRGQIAEPETSRVPMGQAASRNLEMTRLKSKLDPNEPLFELQIPLHASSDDKRRAVEIVLGMYTVMGREFGTDANRLGVFGNRIPHVRFYTTDDFSWRREWHRFRRETGLFWPSRPSIVAGFEGLVRAFSFPYALAASQVPVRLGGAVPEPPAELRDFNLDEAQPA